jgi:hypothetical protein
MLSVIMLNVVMLSVVAPPFSGLYYKNIVMVNDTSRVVISDAPSCGSPKIVILPTLKESFTLSENNSCTGITDYNIHLQSSYFYSTGHKIGINKTYDDLTIIL